MKNKILFYSFIVLFLLPAFFENNAWAFCVNMPKCAKHLEEEGKYLTAMQDAQTAGQFLPGTNIVDPQVISGTPSQDAVADLLDIQDGVSANFAKKVFEAMNKMPATFLEFLKQADFEIVLIPSVPNGFGTGQFPYGNPDSHFSYSPFERKAYIPENIIDTAGNTVPNPSIDTVVAQVIGFGINYNFGEADLVTGVDTLAEHPMLQQAYTTLMSFAGTMHPELAARLTTYQGPVGLLKLVVDSITKAATGSRAYETDGEVMKACFRPFEWLVRQLLIIKGFMIEGEAIKPTAASNAVASLENQNAGSLGNMAGTASSSAQETEERRKKKEAEELKRRQRLAAMLAAATV